MAISPDTLPDAATLLSLTPAEVGGLVLPLLAAGTDRPFHPTAVANRYALRERPDYAPHAERIARVILEGLGWLRAQGLIAEDPEPGHGWSFITRAGREAAASKQALDTFVEASKFPADLLHPEIRKGALPLFQRGDYDTAIFKAFKSIEVAVRARGKFSANDLGVTLMRKAFHPDSGPLRDTTLPPGERQAESDLFAGAIGVYKNPGSHRNVSRSPGEAFKALVHASQLLEIVGGRQ